MIMFAMTLVSFEADASGPVWRVEPDTCLVSEEETSCLMKVTVTLLTAQSERVCVTAINKQLVCLNEGQNRTTIDITVTSDTLLSLHDSNGKQLAEHTLMFSTLFKADFNQRTRLPWSLF